MYSSPYHVEVQSAKQTAVQSQNVRRLLQGTFFLAVELRPNTSVPAPVSLIPIPPDGVRVSDGDELKPAGLTQWCTDQTPIACSRKVFLFLLL